MKTLLLIPSVLKNGLEAAVTADRHPTMDYSALAQALQAEADGHVDLLDYAAVGRAPHPLVRLVRRTAGRDAALALMGFLCRRQYDSIFTNGENVGIPLALLFKAVRKRPGHVTIGHRLSTGKKKLFLRTCAFTGRSILFSSTLQRSENTRKTALGFRRGSLP